MIGCYFLKKLRWELFGFPHFDFFSGMALRKEILCLFFLFAPFLREVAAQAFSFSPMQDVPLEKNGQALGNPFSGGWNSGQFWPCDMNYDGQNDLLVFDKATGRTLVFLREDDNGILRWKYAKPFEDLLPSIQSWLATADFNRDGKLDIFTRSPLGIRVFRNSSDTPGQAAFVLESDGLMSQGFNGQVNIQVNAYGAPALTDVDGDGDLDVLNFDFSGNTVEYHRNRIRETTGSCAGFQLKKDSCVFGRFSTKPQCGQIRLNTGCAGNRPEPGGGTDTDKNIQHLGSQLSALDLDNDGDKDLLVGDLACPLLNKLINGGNAQQALITQADTLFPSAADYVRIRDFPSAYRLDADFDGDTDLVVSPTYFSNFSDAYIHNTRQASFLYANAVPSGAPQFQFQTRDFLQAECLDAGEEAIPAFSDADADGDLDLFVGHLGNQGPGGLRGSVHFYRNIGTAASPAFRLETEDYLGLSSLGLVRLRPVFSDFNLDGRIDFGWMAAKGVDPTDSTIFQFLLNQAAPGQAFSFPSLNGRIRLPLTFNIYDSPLFTDVDGDQLTDLLLGKYNGRLQYWKRTAGGSSLNFALQNANYGNIARAPFANGPNLSAADVNQDGQEDLLISDNSGVVKIYAGFRNQNPAQFLADSSIFFNPVLGLHLPSYGGSFISPMLADLNNDAYPDLTLGYAGGGLIAYVNRFGPNSVSPSEKTIPRLPVWPNPVRAGEVIQLGTGFYSYAIWNSSGQMVDQGKSSEAGAVRLPVRLSAGLYQGRALIGHKTYFFRIQVCN
jgi:hypothetical protein